MYHVQVQSETLRAWRLLSVLVVKLTFVKKRSRVSIFT